MEDIRNKVWVLTAKLATCNDSKEWAELVSLIDKLLFFYEKYKEYDEYQKRYDETMEKLNKMLQKELTQKKR
jgi:hypothetical protein